MTSYKSNQTIVQNGDCFDSFHIIMEGSVAATRDPSASGVSFTLKKGDVIGIFDFGFKEYSYTYTALEDTHVISYPLTDFSVLPALLEEKKDLSHFLVLSMLQNTSRALNTYASLEKQQKIMFQYITAAFADYHSHCQSLNLPLKSLANQELLTPYVPAQEEPAFWLKDYYRALKAQLLEKNPVFFVPSIVTGLLSHGVAALHQIVSSCEDIHTYLNDISQLLLNDTSLDLFGLYTDLIFRAKNAKKDSSLPQESISRMIPLLNSQNHIDKDLVQNRIQEYEAELKRDHSYDSASCEEDLSQIAQKLAHSVDLILDYARPSDECRAEFIRHIDLYKNLTDKNSLEKDVQTIRRQLTKLFNTVYACAFQKALKDPTPPIVIKMFLHFGYVDPELAGLENAAYLYRIAGTYQGDPQQGIYTLYEWILAIYEGRKQPSRNELSQDYASYVHTLRSQGKKDAQSAAKMLEDTVCKVQFELENMFPSVNKVTNGVLSTYCPIFLQENVMKDLSSVLVTPYKIRQIFDQITAIDFSAFYRSYLFNDDKLNIRENVMIDVRPDFILMPNVGSKGICWQEIEGMQRSTPGRMMLSAFHIGNLEKVMIQMIGDFRWELCRRVQGVRWNDVTEHSLTSEYYDYAMFYSKNRDLSQDAKDKIKTALSQARNNYKNLFIADYTNWILYESKGAVKLNKVARRILAAYIPFTEEICNNITANTVFADAIQPYSLKKRQQLHKLNKIVQKCDSQGCPVPEPLLHHIELIDR